METLKTCPHFGKFPDKLTTWPRWDEHQGVMYGAVLEHLCQTPEAVTTKIYTTKSYKTEAEARNAMVLSWNWRENDAEM